MEESKSNQQLIEENERLRKQLAQLEMVENERRIAEHTFLNERYYFDTFMDNLLDPVYFKDVQSRYIKINKAHALFLGLDDPKEALGMSDFDFFPKEEAQISYEQERTIIETGRVLIKEERYAMASNGKPSWYLVTKMPLRSKDGLIIGTFGINQDITVQKEAELAMLKKNKPNQ